MTLTLPLLGAAVPCHGSGGSRAAPWSRPKRSRDRGGARLEACGQQVRVRPERLGPLLEQDLADGRAPSGRGPGLPRPWSPTMPLRRPSHRTIASRTARARRRLTIATGGESPWSRSDDSRPSGAPRRQGRDTAFPPEDLHSELPEPGCTQPSVTRRCSGPLRQRILGSVTRATDGGSPRPLPPARRATMERMGRSWSAADRRGQKCPRIAGAHVAVLGLIRSPSPPASKGPTAAAQRDTRKSTQP